MPPIVGLIGMYSSVEMYRDGVYIALLDGVEKGGTGKANFFPATSPFTVVPVAPLEDLGLVVETPGALGVFT